MRGAQGPLPAALLRHGEVDVMRPGRDLGVEGQPLQARQGQPERRGELGRRTQNRQPGAFEILDAARPLAQPARDVAAEEDDILGLAPGEGFGAETLALGGLGLLPGLELCAGLAIGLHGRLAGHRGPMLDRGQRRANAVHLGSDGVDLGQLLGCDEPLGDHRAIDELGSRVVGRRDQVTAAEPGVAQQAAALGRLLDLRTSDRQVIGRVQAQGTADLLRHRRRFRLELAPFGRGRWSRRKGIGRPPVGLLRGVRRPRPTPSGGRGSVRAGILPGISAREPSSHDQEALQEIHMAGPRSIPERGVPGRERRTIRGDGIGGVAQGLQMSAGPSSESAREVVRARASAAEHPAVAVDQQGDVGREHSALEDAQPVGAGLDRG